MPSSTRQTIDDFLQLKRLAIVGVSRDTADFNNQLFRDLRDRGYQVVPVNPAADKLEGERCYARVQEIDPPVDGVLVMTTPEVTDRIVRDCSEAGVRKVWMHRGAGRGAVSQPAIEYCKANGIDVVPGFCPYMFLAHAGFPHRVHGFIKKLGGSYPR